MAIIALKEINNMVLFFYLFIWNISSSKKNWAQYD